MPSNCMQAWQFGMVTRSPSTCLAQLPIDCRDTIAATLQIPKEKVRVVCKFVGGGFGGKLATEADAVLSALAARELGRPVKTALTRPQTFVNVAHRTESIQRVRLGAGHDGRLLALAHESVGHTSEFDEFTEQIVDSTRHLYAAENRLTTHRLVRLDLPQPGDMRAPGEAIGMLAFEAAMDELAYATGLDPIELRVRNEPDVHPENGKPFSTRKLVDCYREGARRFGWERRPAQPATLRDGRWLVGYGMSAAIRTNFMAPSKGARKLAPDGRLTVQTAMTDIGTGTYTILAQIAAEAMGLPMDRVTVEIGDSNLPPSPGSGGSWGAGSSGSGVYYACMALRGRMASRQAWPTPAQIEIVDGQVSFGGRKLAIDEFMTKYAPGGAGGRRRDQAGQGNGGLFAKRLRRLLCRGGRRYRLR